MLFCLWLIPAQPHYDVMQEQINSLASTYDAPVFSPHATLLCGQTNDVEQLKKELEELFKQTPQLTLTAQSIDYSATYYKTLYVQFEKNENLLSLFKDAKNTADPNSGYELNPHASLIYKNIPDDQKQKLSDQIWPILKDKTKFTFDRIDLMSDTNDEGPEAVKSWKVYQSYALNQ